MSDGRGQFNTPLPIGAGIGFADWLDALSKQQGRDVSKDLEDYDLHGAFLDALQGDERGHFPDTFKKPNHPTFSDESKYHGTMSPMGIPYQGGHWADDGSSFQPSIIQQVLNPGRDLERYFREREPGVKLLPSQTNANGTWGYEQRKPYPGEDAFFRQNKHVGGMAAEDGKITLNPHSELNDAQKHRVAQNEAIRLWMRDTNTQVPMPLTKAQLEQFKGTPYQDGGNDARSSVIARIITKDPSAKDYTEQQKGFADLILGMLGQYGKPTGDLPAIRR